MTPDPVGERLTRELSRLAARVDGTPPPLEVLERRVPGLEAPPRRRLAGITMVAALAGVAAVTVALVALPGTSPPATVASSAAAPPAAASGLSTSAPPSMRMFAVASAGVVLSGSGTVLSSTEPAGQPQWSSDGRWLAFQDAAATTVHVVAADGSGEQVAWKGRIHAFVWSGAGPDVLAVVPADGGLAIVWPDSRVRWVLRPGTAVESTAWRGADLTWTIAQPAPSIGLLPTGGQAVTLGPWPVPGAELVLARWVGTDHLLAWVGGAGHDERQGLALDDIGVDGTRVTGAKTLDTTLVVPHWVVPGPDGTPAAGEVLIVAGGGALPWQAKQVERCDLVEDTCAPLVGLSSSSVTLDPAWSPDGTKVAFVQAPAHIPGAPETVDRWYPLRSLWTAAADGSSANPVPGTTPGAAAPAWAADGASISYSTAATVERIPAGGGNPTVLLASLAGGGSGAGPDGYGKGPWRSLAAWDPAF